MKKLKPKNISLPKLPKGMKRPIKRAQAAEERVTEALSNVPRITNDTVAEHREEVLSSARKYIYPLQHSKHRVVRTSIALFVVVIVGFLAYCGVALYKLQSTSGFMYDVTRVLPFPVAKTGSSWVSYESYLFELRRNMHYYHTQQQANFDTKDGKVQLARLKQQALDQVIQESYVKKLAAENNVNVSQSAVNNQVALVRSQNRLGNSDQVFRDVLNEFWGWDETDFKRELKQQLLKQAVVSKMDTVTHDKADTTLAQLQAGADFAATATKVSDDVSTKTSGGLYAEPITQNDHNLSPLITSEVFKLQTNQLSPVINTGYTLDIIKTTDTTNPKSRRAAHIQFTLNDISVYTKPLAAKHPVHEYISVKS